MLPRIIGLVGPIRSGKTSAAQYLVNELGYELGSNSDILREILGKLAINPDRANLSRLGDAIFSTLGNDTIARARIANLGVRNIVIDGIRYPEEVVAYRCEPSFKLIAIASSDEDRYARAISLLHEGKDVSLGFDSFRELSKARSEADVLSIMEMADYRLSNVGSVRDLEASIRGIFMNWSASNF